MYLSLKNIDMLKFEILVFTQSCIGMNILLFSSQKFVSELFKDKILRHSKHTTRKLVKNVLVFILRCETDQYIYLIKGFFNFRLHTRNEITVI